MTLEFINSYFFYNIEVHTCVLLSLFACIHVFIHIKNIEVCTCVLLLLLFCMYLCIQVHTYVYPCGHLEFTKLSCTTLWAACIHKKQTHTQSLLIYTFSSAFAHTQSYAVTAPSHTHAVCGHSLWRQVDSRTLYNTQRERCLCTYTITYTHEHVCSELVDGNYSPGPYI